MQLIIDTYGVAHGIYSEAINLTSLGPQSIRRASQVEPDRYGQWWADLSPISGPMLGPFELRSAALVAEVSWLNDHPDHVRASYP